ncbi:Carboxylesterase family-domain-containing protein [Aspergillus cavernicola]|uniref:Carboxylesterase family-domain-containing protein n=1 Tax=Aspergillus cavernicola TaxID=176166 RepID=A0ABR4IAP0_9EURO
MHFRSLAGALLLCGPAFAAPAKDRCPAGPSVPTPDSLGTLQTLKYNYLKAENNGTAAVLVHDRLSNSKAQGRCAAVGEKLYPFQTVPDANRTELVYQLDYLVYAKDLRPDDDVWVAGAGDDCLVYSGSQKQAIYASCDLELPAICTARVPPTTDVDRTVVASSKISVRSNDYTLTGYRDARSFRFLGVPFADSPVGELRLAPPRAYSGPKTIDATKLGDSCIQSASGFGASQDISEDCLYLNVFTPVLPGHAHQANRPVAVYFFGGAFTSGTASIIDYDGGNFASRNDVVVVTVNYRLGALGFLATGNLTTGSYGIRDQILALEWVQQHIAAFGGDPTRVNIFGQSAGGQSVIAVLSSSAARGLFSGALVQSAPVDLPWYTREVYSELVVPHVAEAVGCANATSTENSLLSCLRSVPATNFVDNSTAFQTAMSAVARDVGSDYLHVSQLLASIEPLMPMVDDSGSGVIDDQFHTLLATNRLPNRVPTMFTTVTDEAALYISQFIPDLGSSQSGLNTLLGIAFPSQLAQSLINTTAFPTDPAQNDSVRIIGAQALTHSEWTCPQAYLLRNAGSASFPTLYEVEITDGHTQTNSSSIPDICSPNPTYNATCHANDVLPAWGTLNSKTLNVDPYYNTNDILHSQLLNDVFGAFFRSHNPNPDTNMLRLRGPAYASTYQIFGENGYEINQHDPVEQTLALLGMPPSMAQNPGMSEKCLVFEDYGFTFENARFSA